VFAAVAIIKDLQPLISFLVWLMRDFKHDQKQPESPECWRGFKSCDLSELGKGARDGHQMNKILHVQAFYYYLN